MYSRLAALPDEAEPLQRAQLLAALSVGTEIIHFAALCPVSVWPGARRRARRRGAEEIAPRRAHGLTGSIASLASHPGADPDARPRLFSARAADSWSSADALAEHRSLISTRSTRLRFIEVNLFGVYVAPISLLMVAAWFVTIGLRWTAAPLRPAAPCLAPGAVRLRHLHDRAVVNGPGHRPLRSPCPTAETKSEHGKSADLHVVRPAQPACLAPCSKARDPDRSAPDNARHDRRCRRARLGDVERLYGRRRGRATARCAAYVVTMAPEVAGRIVELPVRDNQFVHKGDLLLVIDPTDYRIAVRLAEAAVQQAQANAQTIDAQIAVQQAQITASEAQVEQAQAAVTFSQEQAARYKDLAKREYGTVQMAQQTASNLHKDQAALKKHRLPSRSPSARSRPSRRSAPAPRRRSPRPSPPRSGEGQSGAHPDPFSGKWLGHQSPGAAG